MVNLSSLLAFNDVIISGIILLLSIIVAYVVDYYSRRTIFRFKTKDNAPLRLPIFLFVISLGLNLLVYINDNLFILQTNYIEVFFRIFTVFIAAILANRIIKSSLADSSVKRKMDLFSLRILQRISTWSISFTCFWIIVALLGYDIGNNLILILVALVSIILAFAIAKDTLGNLISGLIIFIWKPFKHGDYLLVKEKNFSGIITNIGLIFSKLIDNNQNTIIVPNNILLQNKSYVSQDKNYPIIVTYATSNFQYVDKIRRLLIQSAINTTNVEEKPRPIALISDFNNNEVIIELISYTTKYNQLRKISSNIRTNFLKELKASGKINKTKRKSEYFDPEEMIY